MLLVCTYPRNCFPDLGYSASESYGVAYKARGLCNDLTNLDIYDDDNGLNYGVTGNIKSSELHHNVRPSAWTPFNFEQPLLCNRILWDMVTCNSRDTRFRLTSIQSSFVLFKE